MKPFDRIVAGVCSAVVAAAVVLGHLASRGATVLPATAVCWSQRLLGRACPGCGLTRSFLLLGQGSIRAASVMNPLGPILFVWILALVAIRAGKAVAPRFRWWTEIDLGFFGAAVVAVLVRTVTFYAV